mmetsp:Transcript_1973/g.6169  ORF Transcript_1973/g.6169 Transcript_1973/m.6169 type:complete len:188 (-) Transcript_1973:52-615(-)|eukprot:CAMPEP_0175238032 /NCGR_PEP_ID=MMETSP0093-20121207/28827_1 /TAXON_ID=311494 /ORGANISM="Alexandrium monilatum, Strain CCMP3105" /LENGTH=187 /DNA_ID=CAMNT_0016532031 /DNA_START=48 /DNA_END=611 /DNA_ORIENTATION=-
MGAVSGCGAVPGCFVEHKGHDVDCGSSNTQRMGDRDLLEVIADETDWDEVGNFKAKPETQFQDENAFPLKSRPVVELVFLDRAPIMHSDDEDRPPTSARNVVFKSRPDRTKSFTFTRRPLGLNFRKGEAPLVILSVDHNSDGEAVGVETGMELLRVGGEDLSGLLYKESFARLVKALQVLPSTKTVL